MINRETILSPADKCGVRKVKCFTILEGTYHRYAYVGQFIKCSARRVRGNSKFKKGKKFKAMIVRSKIKSLRKDGMCFWLKINNCVLLKKRLTTRGKNIRGPIAATIKRKKFMTAFSAKI